MPELPDHTVYTVYLDALNAGIVGRRSERSRIASPGFDNGTLTLTEAGTKKRASFFVWPRAIDALERLQP